MPPGSEPVTLTAHERGALDVRRRFPGTGNPRLVLRFSPAQTRTWASFVDSPELWDSRHTAALTPPDPALLALQDRGEYRQAFTAAGFDMDMFARSGPPGMPIYVRTAAVARVRTGRFDLKRLPAPSARRRPGAGTVARSSPPEILVDVDGLTVRFGPYWRDVPLVPTARAMRPIDFDLVRLGLLPVSALHPLVAAALFPDAAATPTGALFPDAAPAPGSALFPDAAAPGGARARAARAAQSR